MSIKFSTLLIVTLPLSAALWAQTPAEQGLEIANARKAADRGWVSSQSDSLMILRNKQGDQSKRKLRTFLAEILNTIVQKGSRRIFRRCAPENTPEIFPGAARRGKSWKSKRKVPRAKKSAGGGRRRKATKLEK